MINLDKNKIYLEKRRNIITIENGVSLVPDELKEITPEEAMKMLLKGKSFSVYGTLKERPDRATITSDVVSIMATAEGILVTTHSGSLYEVQMKAW